MNCKISVKYLSSNISSSPQLLEASEAVQSDLLKTSSEARVGKLAPSLSDNSSPGQCSPQKIPRLETAGLKSVSEVSEVSSIEKLRSQIYV